MIVGFILAYLGRHISGRAGHARHIFVLTAIDGAAKIDQFDRPRLHIHNDILGFDIAMYNTMFVHMFYSLNHIASDLVFDLISHVVVQYTTRQRDAVGPFHNDAHEILIDDISKELNDVIVLEVLHDIDFFVQKRYVDGVLQDLARDTFVPPCDFKHPSESTAAQPL